MPEANLFVEKREFPRISVMIPVHYYLAEDVSEIEHIVEWRLQGQNAKVLDMSLGGMHIILDEKLLTGSVVRFDMSLPTKPEPLILFAEVVWVNKDGAGLHFIHMLNEDVECLKAFMAEVSPAE
jgi:c-di-GMP-binding flagellar brake protein YcgR